MAGHYVEDIPQDYRRELESLLDNHPTLNWRALIRHMPANWYHNYQVEGFGMKALDPGGSPTNALLNDLSIRHVTLQQLVFWLQQLTTQGQYPRLQSLLSKLQEISEPLTITRQPDELYRYPAGSSVHMKCEASPSNGVNYQWFKRKQPLQGKTQPLLHLQNITKDDQDQYICRVSLKEQRTYEFTRWAKLEILESLPEMAKPIITTQPCCADQTVLGGILHLYCDAVGDPPPSFQWYMDSKPLPGATDRVYNKANLCQDDEGVYQCVASNRAGQAFSNRVLIKVSKRPIQSDCVDGLSNRQQDLHGRNPGIGSSPLYLSCKVSDKVALLIGNKDYENSGLGQLYHPTNDVCDLAGVLTSIGFKVVSLVNLTLSEMEFAVKQFYEMLDENMYALFYFAGHGFEAADNQSYLMPVDASTRYSPNENLSASKVIKQMQSSQAYLNIAILDSCRTQPKRSSDLNPNEGLEVKKKNVMIVFPCCSKNSVFESERHTNGYFAHYLLKHIGGDATITDVMLLVSQGIDQEDIRDPQTGQKQIVYRTSTIAEQLSLKAPVDPKAPTKSSQRWKAAHEIPQHPIVVFKDGDCAVELLFFAEFSNVLLVHARFTGDNSQNSFILEPDVQMNQPLERQGCTYERIKEKDPTVPSNFPLSNSLFQAIRIKDLQRLKGDLWIDIEVNMASKPRECSNCRIKYTMDAKPLYAKIVHTSR